MELLTRYIKLSLILVSLLTSTKSEDDGLGDVLAYMKRFSAISISPKLSGSVSGGEGRDENVKDVETSPLFMEGVMLIQRAAGLDLTGVINNELMKVVKSPRCGMSDPSHDSGVANYATRQSWSDNYDRNSRTYQIEFSFFTRNTPSTISEENSKKGILAAMCLWESNSDVRFIKVDDNTDADIKISYEQEDHKDGFNFDGASGVLAHAFYPTNGRLHFDIKEPWYLAESEKTDYDNKDVFTVAAHELGHILGLEHSSVSEALMAPIYRFSGSYKKFILPDDDKAGVQSLYGFRKSARYGGYSACVLLRDEFNAVITNENYQPEKKPDVLPTTSTTTKYTTTTTKTTTTRQSKKEECMDDVNLGRNCPRWKEKGYCEDKQQGEAMSRVCKKTCGYCPVVEKEKGKTFRPRGRSGSNADKICDVEKFDTVVTLYDYRDTFHAYFGKDNYYFPMSVIVDSNDPSLSLLNATEVEPFINWKTDPKSISPGIYTYDRSDFLERSNGVLTTLVYTQSFFIAFRDDGSLDIYQNDGPRIRFIRNAPIREIFNGYPHSTVDAAYVEEGRIQSIFSLFKGSQIWQYEGELLTGSGQITETWRSFMPAIQGADIKEWKGVAADNIDAVFKYKDIPYFLKNNVFWPAVGSEPMVLRDITYNFFRCWEVDPKPTSIPSGGGTSTLSPISFLFSFSFLLCLRLL